MKRSRKLRTLSDLRPKLYITIYNDNDNKLKILNLIERKGMAFEYYYSNTQSEQWSVSECNYYFRHLGKNNTFLNKTLKTISMDVNTSRLRRAGLNEIYRYKLTKLSQEIEYKEKFHENDSIFKNLMLPFD